MVEPANPAPARRGRGRPRAFEDKREQNTVKSLDRALGVLDALARLGGATLSGLAQETGEAPATLYRVLVTLQAHRMAEFDEALQSWHVGAGAFRVGSAFLRRTNLAERARPALRRLMEETGETANLGVEREGAVLFVSQAETHAAIRAFFPPGTRSPLHASGVGKALLACAPRERLARLVEGGLEGYTPRTITDAARLLAELDLVRARGFAVDDEERTEGMRCVAAPIRDGLGEAVGGLSVSGPVSRMGAEAVAAHARAVIAAAEAVSLALGAAPSAPGAAAAGRGG